MSDVDMTLCLRRLKNPTVYSVDMVNEQGSLTYMQHDDHSRYQDIRTSKVTAVYANMFAIHYNEFLEK